MCVRRVAWASMVFCQYHRETFQQQAPAHAQGFSKLHIDHFAKSSLDPDLVGFDILSCEAIVHQLFLQCSPLFFCLGHIVVETCNSGSLSVTTTELFYTISSNFLSILLRLSVDKLVRKRLIALVWKTILLRISISPSWPNLNMSHFLRCLVDRL